MLIIYGRIQNVANAVSKIIQSGRIPGALLGKLASPLIKATVSLAKNVLAPLGTIILAPALDAAIQRNFYG